jgi:hypothetical protein
MRLLVDLVVTAIVVGVVSLATYGAKTWMGLATLARDYGLSRDTLADGLLQSSSAAHGPIEVLLAGAFVPALALALFVLAPTWLVVRRRHARWPRWRQLATWSAVGAVAAAVLLESIDPVLARPEVPLGPRAFLNSAFELVGYGFVNALAYAAAIGGALLFGMRRRRADALR